METNRIKKLLSESIFCLCCLSLCVHPLQSCVVNSFASNNLCSKWTKTFIYDSFEYENIFIIHIVEFLFFRQKHSKQIEISKLFLDIAKLINWIIKQITTNFARFISSPQHFMYANAQQSCQVLYSWANDSAFLPFYINVPHMWVFVIYYSEFCVSVSVLFVEYGWSSSCTIIESNTRKHMNLKWVKCKRRERIWI